MFDAQTRKKIKKESKHKVKEALGRCILLQLLYSIPIMLITIMMYVSAVGLQTNTGDSAFAGNAAANANAMWLVLLLVFFVIGPLQYGTMRFYIRMHRGEEVSVGMLLQPFASLQSYGAGVRMMFCMFCRYVIWLFVPVFVLTMIALFGMFTLTRSGWVSQSEMMQFVFGIYLIGQVILLPFMVKLMSYHVGWLELHDNEKVGVWAATRNGAELFHGYYGKLFVFLLSFAGWYLLSQAILLITNLIVNYSDVIASPTQALVVSIVALIAGGFLQIVVSGFLTAYFYTSFWGFCDVLAKREQLEAEQMTPMQ